ncbi:BnaA03g58420D [Brassica napus]|uniref:BnaA03g58420D protein n=1 Tax=Brassica napus TaxID=3708 RepID=A0A078JCS7_BRANA|nr:BnaA03g58420D [Brassica napus]
MIQSRYVFFAFLALSFLLADVEATELVSDGSIFSPNKGAVSLCCNDHPVVGVCVKINIATNGVFKVVTLRLVDIARTKLVDYKLNVHFLLIPKSDNNNKQYFLLFHISNNYKLQLNK